MSAYSGNKMAVKCSYSAPSGGYLGPSGGSSDPSGGSSAPSGRSAKAAKSGSTPHTDPNPVHSGSPIHGKLGYFKVGGPFISDHLEITKFTQNVKRFGHIEAGKFQGVPIWTDCKDSLPVYQALLKLSPCEFRSFKEALDLNARGLPLPDNPTIRNLLKLASFEKFKSVFKSIMEQSSMANSPHHEQVEDFKHLYPMVKVVMNFKPHEFDSFKDAMNHYTSKSHLKNHHVVRKFLEAAPNKKFEPLLTHAVECDNLFSSHHTAHLEKHFKYLTPMVQTIVSMPVNEFSSFKKTVDKYEVGSPLPDCPALHKIIRVTPSKEILASFKHA